jgi:acyl-coenzyme A synthetase/AMP-(fatty) acid ligase
MFGASSAADKAPSVHIRSIITSMRLDLMRGEIVKVFVVLKNGYEL